jgi:hypothetical protein
VKNYLDHDPLPPLLPGGEIQVLQNIHEALCAPHEQSATHMGTVRAPTEKGRALYVESRMVR